MDEYSSVIRNKRLNKHEQVINFAVECHFRYTVLSIGVSEEEKVSNMKLIRVFKGISSGVDREIECETAGWGEALVEGM